MRYDVRRIFIIVVFFTGSSSEELEGRPGGNVTLMCQDPKQVAVTLLLWRKADLKDDYVFYFRNKRPSPSFQHPSYRGRVELKDPEMKNGDVSVVLKNITVNDTGTYECRVGYDQRVPISTINLTVEPANDGGTQIRRVGLTVGSVVLVLLLVL